MVSWWQGVKVKRRIGSSTDFTDYTDFKKN